MIFLTIIVYLIFQMVSICTPSNFSLLIFSHSYCLHCIVANFCMVFIVFTYILVAISTAWIAFYFYYPSNVRIIWRSFIRSKINHSCTKWLFQNRGLKYWFNFHWIISRSKTYYRVWIFRAFFLLKLGRIMIRCKAIVCKHWILCGLRFLLEVERPLFD